MERSHQQDVISAVHLLLRSLDPSEREMLLSTLMHEQNECVQIGEPESLTNEVAELVQSQYPIQPLVLDTEESPTNAALSSSESYAPGEKEATYEAGSEGRYGEKVLATYASFFFPLTASFTRRRWWGYLAVCTIFLLTVLFSTLVSYKAGMQVGMAMDGPSVVSLPVGCMQSPIVMPAGGVLQLLPGQTVAAQQISWRHEPIMLIDRGSDGSYSVNLLYRENIQCSLLPIRVIIQP